MPLLRNRGIFRVFSPALDLEKTAFFDDKNRPDGEWFVGGGCYRKISDFSGS